MKIENQLLQPKVYFIRAPMIVECGPNVKKIAYLDNHVTAVL